jgi:hypothetical protein
VDRVAGPAGELGLERGTTLGAEVWFRQEVDRFARRHVQIPVVGAYTVPFCARAIGRASTIRATAQHATPCSATAETWHAGRG